MLSIVWMSSSCTTHLIKRAANNFCSGNSLKERKLLANWRTFLSYFEGKLKNSLTSSTCVNQTWNPLVWITNTATDHHVTNWNILKNCFLKLSVIHWINLVQCYLKITKMSNLDLQCSSKRQRLRLFPGRRLSTALASLLVCSCGKYECHHMNILSTNT